MYNVAIVPFVTSQGSGFHRASSRSEGNVSVALKHDTERVVMSPEMGRRHHHHHYNHHHHSNKILITPIIIYLPPPPPDDAYF